MARELFVVLSLMGFLALPDPVSGSASQRAADTIPEVSLDPEPFQEGMELLKEGDWEEALAYWGEVSEDYTTLPDPRIGIAYLEAAVEHQAEYRYPMASELLIWGFSGTRPDEVHGEALLQEVDRIMPLLEEDQVEEWESLRDSTSGTLAAALRGFWIRKDPTPTTALNERLIEHWERIHHARTHFRYSTDSPYGTDDRGVIYVKFGPPDRQKSGFLGAGEFELLVRVPNDPQAREAMRRYDTHPQYEVWVYDSLNPDDFTHFLFGNEDGRGRFRLVESVSDLIGPEARTDASSRYTPGGVRMAYYLELFYYRDLSAVGGRFGRRFAELDDLWNLYTTRRNPATGGLPAPSESTLQSYSYRYQLRDRHDPEAPPKIPALSAYEGAEREEIVVQAIRTLQDNEPRLVITALSASKLGVRDRSGLRRQRLESPGFSMRHTLIVRDSLHREVGRLTERATSMQGDVSTFVLRHVDQAMNLTMTGETLREGDSTEVSGPTPGPPYPGQAHFRPLEPLNTDPDHLEISDLATGVRIPENIDGSGFLFPLLPTPQIWQEDPLLVYLEVYHLGLDMNGAGRFRADFRIVPLRDDGAEDPSRGPVTLSVDLESEGPTFGRSFFINLHDQEVGPYRVEVEVTDLLRGGTRSRQAPLEIMG